MLVFVAPRAFDIEELEAGEEGKRERVNGQLSGGNFLEGREPESLAHQVN
jgi:hypothetical protein